MKNNPAEALKITAKAAKDCGITIEELNAAIKILEPPKEIGGLSEAGINGAKAGASLRKLFCQLANKRPAVAVFQKGNLKRKQYYGFRKSSTSSYEDWGRCYYYIDKGEEAALKFRKLLVKQKCFPIKYRETENEITITYHYMSPVVELTSPIEVVK